MTQTAVFAMAKDPWSLAGEIKQRWHAGSDPDAAAALAEFPELELCRSVVIDLAYEE